MAHRDRNRQRRGRPPLDAEEVRLRRVQTMAVARTLESREVERAHDSARGYLGRARARLEERLGLNRQRRDGEVWRQYATGHTVASPALLHRLERELRRELQAEGRTPRRQRDMPVDTTGPPDLEMPIEADEMLRRGHLDMEDFYPQDEETLQTMDLCLEILDGMRDKALASLIALLDTDDDQRLRQRTEYLREHAQLFLDDELG